MAETTESGIEKERRRQKEMKLRRILSALFPCLLNDEQEKKRKQQQIYCTGRCTWMPKREEEKGEERGKEKKRQTARQKFGVLRSFSLVAFSRGRQRISALCREAGKAEARGTEANAV